MSSPNNHEHPVYSSDLTIEAAFLQAIGNTPLLEAKQEIELAQQMERGGERGHEAREELIKANQRLVVHIAKRYQWCPLSLADLIQEGTLGLIHAVDRFDWRRGYRFSTYATWWIRRSIGQAAHKARVIHLPEHQEQAFFRLKRAQLLILSEHGREASDQELSTYTGLPLSQIIHLRSFPEVTISLNSFISEDGEGEMIELYEFSGETRLEELSLAEAYSEDLRRVLEAVLTPRESEALRLRYGLDENGPFTFKETAYVMQLSEQRVRQLIARAFVKLRHPEVLAQLQAEIPAKTGEPQGAKRLP